MRCFFLARSGSQAPLESVEELSVSEFLMFSSDGSMLMGLELPWCPAEFGDGLLCCLRTGVGALGGVGTTGALLFVRSWMGVAYRRRMFARGHSNMVSSKETFCIGSSYCYMVYYICCTYIL